MRTGAKFVIAALAAGIIGTIACVVLRKRA